jgi:hypothetical protein
VLLWRYNDVSDYNTIILLEPKIILCMFASLLRMAWRSTGNTNLELISNMAKNGIFTLNEVQTVSFDCFGRGRVIEVLVALAGNGESRECYWHSTVRHDGSLMSLCRTEAITWWIKAMRIYRNLPVF